MDTVLLVMNAQNINKALVLMGAVGGILTAVILAVNGQSPRSEGPTH